MFVNDSVKIIITKTSTTEKECNTEEAETLLLSDLAHTLRKRLRTHPQHMILWRNIKNYHFFIILIPTPASPHFYNMLGANLGSLLYGDVSVM